MKKLVSILAISSALLVACNNDTENTAPKTETTEVENVTNSETTPAKTDTATQEATSAPVEKPAEITPEKAEEVTERLVKEATEEKLLKDITIDDQAKTITAKISFDEEATDEERGIFLLNYTIFLEKQYPDKEVKFDIAK